ncbi:hypothetical protein CBL_20440 [Carabus blaptoides fortunei]
MDRWLKAGTIKNDDINDDEPPSIPNEPVKKKARKTRKYDKEYLKFGFSWTGDEKEPIPFCVICSENLTNESMKPSNLKRHFETNHNQEALATRKMPADIQKVLDESVKIINYIKGRPLNARLFSQMCEEMGSSHTQLLFHTDVRWLSRGKILNRLFELRHELQVFLNDRFELRNCLHDWKWLCKLAYLADIFSVLNCLNLSLQGKGISMFHVKDKVNATMAKLNLWQKRVGNGEVDSFPTLYEFITSSTDQIDADTLKCITQHLENLQVGLKNYFPDLNKNIEWIRYPFNINATTMPEGLSHTEEEQLLELASDGFLKHKHKECTLTSFWLQMQHVFTYILCSKNQLAHDFIKLIDKVPKENAIEVLLADQYPAINSKEFKNHLKERNIELILTTVDAPFSNGLNERLNQTLVNRIRCMLNTDGKKEGLVVDRRSMFECIQQNSSYCNRILSYIPDEW